jgi:hypothetical protein
MLEALQVEPSGDRRPRKLDDGRCLAEAETEFAKRLSLEVGEIPRAGEGVERLTIDRHG